MRIPLALVSVLFLVPFAAAGEGEGEHEAWERVHIAGAHAGYQHTRSRVVGGMAKQVETTVRSEIAMTRAGQTIEIASLTTTRESLDGVLQHIVSTSRMSNQESTTHYAFADGKVTITTRSMGTERTVEKAVPAELVGPLQSMVSARRLAGTTDESYVFTSFMAELQDVATVTLTSHGLEDVTLADGSTAPATRVEASLVMGNGKAAPFAPVSWLDDAGWPVKTRVEPGGMLFETYRVGSEAAAKAEGETRTEPAPDVFLASLLQEDDPIPVPRRLEQAWYVVRTRTPDATLPDLAGPAHHVTVQEDGSVLVHARRRVPPIDRLGVRPLADVPDDLRDALAPSSMIQSDAPEIVQIMQDTVGRETSAWPAAQRLEAWVAKHITVKSMGVAFGSALEACRSGEGDCTEHAVLLAALCRAAGIPARVVMGLEYMLGIWGGHAWNEVWIDGRWYALDATNGLGFVDPLHLPLASLVMKEGGASEFVSLLSSLGTLDVDIIEVVRDGRNIRVDDASLVTITPESYSNAILGIAFKTPHGWTPTAHVRKPGMSARVIDVDGSTDRGAPIQITIDMMDVPAQDSWDDVFTLFGTTADRATSGKVDGRPARTWTEARPERTQRRIVVMADGALWTFTLDHAAHPTQEAALAALLDTVDFDVK